MTAIWNATDLVTATGTMRIPADTSSSSTPGYLTVDEIGAYLGVISSGTAGQIPIYASTGKTLSGDATHINLSNVMSYGPNGATNPAWKVDASVASLVNGMTLTGSATGVAPTLSATGNDTNISLTLSTKGSGTLSLSAGGSINIRSSAIIVAAGVTTFAPGRSSTASATPFVFNSTAIGTLTASAEAISVHYNIGAGTQTHSTGAIALQRDFRITPATHAAVGASVITDAYSFYVDSAPVAGTNVTITNAYALGLGGNLSFATLGAGLAIKKGTNGRVESGIAISGGTSVVANTSVTANSLIDINLTGTQTSPGFISYVATAGVGFTVTSSNALHAGNFWYQIIEGL